MKSLKKICVFLFPWILLILMLCACTIPGLPAGFKSTADLLHDSATRTRPLTSVHLQVTETVTSRDLAPYMSGNGQSTITGYGDMVLPDQIHVVLDTGKEIVIEGKQEYFKLPSDDVWYKLLPSDDSSEGGNNSVDPQEYAQSLYTGPGGNAGPLGTKNVNGKILKGINLPLDIASAQKLARISSLAYCLQDGYRISHSVLDIWVDDATLYPHLVQSTMKLSMDSSCLISLMGYSASDTNSSNSPLPSKVEVTLEQTLDCSRFNEPVSIPTPAPVAS